MLKTKNANEYFESSDLSLVAALCCYGAVIESVDRSKQRAVFYMRREKGMTSLVQAFYEHTLQVEPLSYFQALRESKTRLYEPPIT